MKYKIILVMLIIFIPLSSASAFVEYGDGWRKICDDAGKCQFSNYHTIQRWDGQYIPYSSLNITTEQWTYQLLQNDTHYNLRVVRNFVSEWLSLPKNFANYNFGLTDISFSFTVTPAQLNSRSVANGSGLWYIPIPDKAVKTRFIWDDVKPFIYKNNNQSLYLNDTDYWYSKVNDQIRLNYNQNARNFGIASTNVTFVYDSWTINGSTTPTWINSSGINQSMNPNNGHLETSLLNDNYLSRWERGIKDWNITSAKDCTLGGNAIFNSSGLYLDGDGDYCSASGSLNLSIPYTIFTSFQTISSTRQDIYSEGQISSAIGYIRLSVAESTGVEDNVTVNERSDAGIEKKFGSGDVNVIGTGTHNLTTVMNNMSEHKLYYDISNSYVNTQTYDVTTPNYRTIGALGRSTKAIYFNGIIYKIIVYQTNLSILGVNNYKTSSKRTIWYDSGSGNETYQINVNATTPENTNYSVWYRQNATGDFVLLNGTGHQGNTSHVITTKYQNTDVIVQLFGNITATPELIDVTFLSQSASASGVPNITSYSNNKTNDASSIITINISEPVNFNATANQTLTMWNWSKDGTDQNNNFDNITLSWATSGRRNVSVNGSNANGITQYINWTVEVRSNITNRFDAIADTFISSDNINTNYGRNELWINNINPFNNVRSPHLNFSISGITDTEIDTAYLHVKVYNFTQQSTSISIKTANSGWSEDTLTWNTTIPTTTTSYTFTATGDGEYDIDITDIVKSWVNGSVAQNGIRFVTGGNMNFYINSRENLTVDASYIQINLTTINGTPNITSWSNNFTNNDSLSFGVEMFQNILFNGTANQTLTSWTWTTATQINGSNENFSFAFYNFTTSGIKTVSVYGSNGNGTTKTKTWTINVNNTYPVITPVFSMNQSQYDAILERTDNAGMLGLVGGILGGALAVSILRRKTK